MILFALAGSITFTVSVDNFYFWEESTEEEKLVSGESSKQQHMKVVSYSDISTTTKRFLFFKLDWLGKPRCCERRFSGG